jgi:pimeloyl-ACP methyl ester carboxylesterase
MSERYSKIRVPVVIVTGDKDRIVSANENAYRLHSVVPGSQLIELRDTGHEIPQTHPESIYSALSLISQSKGQLIAMNQSSNIRASGAVSNVSKSMGQ